MKLLLKNFMLNSTVVLKRWMQQKLRLKQRQMKLLLKNFMLNSTVVRVVVATFRLLVASLLLLLVALLSAVSQLLLPQQPSMVGH